jgi:methyl-accepting chemotaxis protein
MTTTLPAALRAPFSLGGANAIDAQLATVTGILASIDETSLAARDIARLIGGISERIGDVASEARNAGQMAEEAGQSLVRMEATMGQFLQRVTE